MVAAWPEPVERVSTFLREAGAEARIEQFTKGTPTAADAAAAVGCELSQIVKSLVLVCDERPVIALVPGDRRGDPEKVAREAGAASARIASPEEVAQGDRLRPGRGRPVPPPGRGARPARSHACSGTGSCGREPGRRTHIVGLAPSELGRLARARHADVVQEPKPPSAAA